jgi:D-lactate dehydrogenase (cytochrome)
VSNTCRTRPPEGGARDCPVVRDPVAMAAHLEDAAHFPGGYAEGIAYPRSEAEVAHLVRTHRRVLPVGAQSSLTGGATPFGDVVLSTARLARVLSAGPSRAVVEAGVTLDGVQAALAPLDAVYPPVPTFGGATVGGAVATNAAGAATFKYGSTRDWVEGLTVVLASGECLDLVRGDCLADERGFLIHAGGSVVSVPVGRYRPPDVPKRSAGYHAAPRMDLIDLFIGSEGTLGVVTRVTVRALSPAPAVALALVFCRSEQEGIALAAALRSASRDTWRDRDPCGIDACAIEHMDDRSLALVQAMATSPGCTSPCPPAPGWRCSCSWSCRPARRRQPRTTRSRRHPTHERPYRHSPASAGCSGTSTSWIRLSSRRPATRHASISCSPAARPSPPG